MGHKRTIRPNAKKLSALFLKRNQITWNAFANKVRYYQRGSMGEPNEMKPGQQEFLEYPYSCICKKPQRNDTNGTANHGEVHSGQVGTELEART